ncbi:hypothetical protein MSTO_51260 [Mycobacterium stomatepiae]|uniref:Transcriptional regulator n=1 Tax=Mycobacterium stomatepiae TaxID=470076 RepID=A0A7I7QFD0_9MYCO|nr:hypothetical protein MSTO_51260 [Mycobacterium stomatepiae]
MLASISTDYYLRLEQAREENPSGEVLDAIAGALKLDDDAAAYMHNLVRQNSAQRRGESLREIHPELEALLDSWPLTVAYVCDPNLDVVLANSLAEKVSPNSESVSTPCVHYSSSPACVISIGTGGY